MQSIIYKNKPLINCSFSLGGPKETLGNVGKYLDITLKDDMVGQDTFEKAETEIQRLCIDGIIKKSKKKSSEIGAIMSGDLLNQIISASFSARNFKIPFLGLYNACATFCESMILGSCLVDSGFRDNVICLTSSHFASAERQYRYPLELGSVRSPLAQWTVTGAGATMISSNKETEDIKGDNSGKKIFINSATIGKIVDFGVTDSFNMGAAMAPSCTDTLFNHFVDLDIEPSYYDIILTGDLGTFGSRIFKDLLWEKGFDVEKQHVDMGELCYNLDETEYQGGSGAGCSSMVFNSYVVDKMRKGEFRKVLIMSTGALLSSLTVQQGESIPGITHAVSLSIS